MNTQSTKTLSKVSLAFHFIITLIITCFLEKPDNSTEILGAIAGTIGFSVLVIISYLCLSYKKIQKTGSYIFIILQIMGCSGNYFSYLVNTTDNYYFLGIFYGVVSNIFYIVAMLLLLKDKSSATETTTKKTINLNNEANTITQSCAICPNCGNNIASPGQKFCSNCGNQLQRANKQTTNIDAILKDTSPLVQEAEFQKPKTCINFSDIEKSEEEVNRNNLNKITVPKDETILSVGKVNFQGFSVVPWVISVITWIIEAVLIILSYDVHYTGFLSKDWYLLGINFAYEWGHGKGYYPDGIFTIIILIALIGCIPLVFLLITKSRIENAELVLTNQRLYFARNEEVQKIEFDQIISMEYKPCTFFNRANKICIILLSDTHIIIRGLSNAPEFAEKTVQAYKSSKENTNKEKYHAQNKSCGIDIA